MTLAWFEKVQSQLFPLLAPRIRKALEEWAAHAPAQAVLGMEEWRLRRGHPPLISTATGDYPLRQGPGDPSLIVSHEDLEMTLQLMTRYSPYARQEEMRNLFLALPGGHRVGLAGQVVAEGGSIKILQHVSSMNVRLARSVHGCGKPVIGRILLDKKPASTLIISPPGCGKTTMLRDLARLTSNGMPQQGVAPSRVGIVDERSELAGCLQGVPQHDVGSNTDVLDGCPKATGMRLMIRCMNPEVIVADEIGSPGDTEAVLDALNAGVRLMTTAHGKDMSDIMRRPQLRQLTETVQFSYYVILSRRRGPGTVERIVSGYDRSQRRKDA